MSSSIPLVISCLAFLAISLLVPPTGSARLLNNHVPGGSEPESNKLKLISFDGESFSVDKTVAFESIAIKSIVDHEEWDGQGIYLTNVTGKTLAKVLEYAKKHAELGARAADHVKAWDAEFVKVDQAMLFDLVLASYHLNISGLLDLTSQTVANMAKGKTQKEIREMFNIKESCSPAEDLDDKRQWVA